MGLVRGADRDYALDLSLLISVPVLIASACVDVYGAVVVAATPTGVQMLGCFLASVAHLAHRHQVHRESHVWV